MTDQEIWFVVGSQAMYGPEVLETVAARGAEMAAFIDGHPLTPCRFVYKATIKSAQEVTDVVKEANYDDRCCGVVTWAHTFSPSKMWINGLALLQKPWCHFATQYNRSIPDKQIDMDFMNLNQAAHGDREHGFIGARMRLPRKVVVGYWQDEEPLKELGEWMRAAVGLEGEPRSARRALRRQHARGGGHRRRQGRSADQAGLAGEHLAGGRAGGRDRQGHRRRGRRLARRVPGGVRARHRRCRRGALPGQGRDRDGAHP